MWCFGTPVILILVCYISLCDAQVTLELCQSPVKDMPCILKCNTPDLTQSVVFKKDNTEYASCKFILGTLSCTSIYPTRSLISQQSSLAAVTSLNITQLSRAGDQGSWTCDYGSTGSSAQTLTVLTAPSQRDTSEGLEINFCTDSERDSEDVTLTVTCSSAVNVWAVLNSTTSDKNHNYSVPVTKGAACSDVAENIYTAVFTIANTTGNFTGDNYKLYFKVQLDGGVGPVYETVYPGNITFPCEITTTTTDNTQTSSEVQTTGTATAGTTTTSTPVKKTDELTEEEKVIIITTSSVGGFLLLLVIILVIFCCMRKTKSSDLSDDKRGKGGEKPRYEDPRRIQHLHRVQQNAQNGRYSGEKSTGRNTRYEPPLQSVRNYPHHTYQSLHPYSSLGSNNYRNQSRRSHMQMEMRYYDPYDYHGYENAYFADTNATRNGRDSGHNSRRQRQSHKNIPPEDYGPSRYMNYEANWY